MSSIAAVEHTHPVSGRWWVALDLDSLEPLAVARELDDLRAEVEDIETSCELEAAPSRSNPSKPMPPNAHGIPLDVLEQTGNWRGYWPPLVVSYGLGVDSTAVLVGFRRMGIKPTAIIFADTGAEKPETYHPLGGHIADYYQGDRRDYYSIISDYLAWAGFPPITVVRLRPPKAPYKTLEGQGLHTGQLPSLAYGFHRHGCSIKWKGEVIDKYIAQWPPYLDSMAHGTRPIRVIGYDDSTADLKRSRRFALKVIPGGPQEPQYTKTGKLKATKPPIGEWAWWYPLQTWGWDRERCKAEILAEGLPVPQKSSCFFCVGGETEVVTRSGIKPIRELAGANHELLVPRVGTRGGLSHRGSFVSSAVRSFGVQPLWEVRLRKGPAEKVVRATSEHRWFLAAEPGSQWVEPVEFERTTQNLKTGDRLRPLRATRHVREALMPVAVAQGFVFGDGTRPVERNTPASVMLYALEKDEALVPYFSPLQARHSYVVGGKPVMQLYGLPRSWKDLPPLSESRSFLLSWLAGYFAADGHVSKNGHACLESADLCALRFARDAAAVCGVGYGRVRSRLRQGFGAEPSVLHRVSFRVRDLPEWFFIIKEHARRANAIAKTREALWRVVSTQPLGVAEEVFCAVVPGAQAFGLAEDLMTGNCPAMKPHEVDELMDLHPELAARIEALELNAQQAVHEYGSSRVAPERWGQPKLTSIRGLWGQGETMTEYMRRRRLGLQPDATGLVEPEVDDEDDEDDEG